MDFSSPEFLCKYRVERRVTACLHDSRSEKHEKLGKNLFSLSSAKLRVQISIES